MVERSKLDSITRPPAFSSAWVKRILNPETKFLVDSRLIRVEWLVDQPTDPWLDLRIYRMNHLSIHFHVGRFYIRYAPWSKQDWAEAKRNGNTGARNRNRNRAVFTETT